MSKICIENSFNTVMSIYPVKSEGRLARTPLILLQVDVLYVLNKAYLYIFVYIHIIIPKNLTFFTVWKPLLLHEVQWQDIYVWNIAHFEISQILK